MDNQEQAEEQPGDGHQVLTDDSSQQGCRVLLTFKMYPKNHIYTTGIISIRSGLIQKPDLFFWPAKVGAGYLGIDGGR